MRNNKVAGTNKILVEAYKDTPNHIIEILKKIYNFCLDSEDIPSQ